MATVFINPTFAVNGDGSTWTEAATTGGAGAFNAWGAQSWTSGTLDLTHFWKSGTTYLQCEETTYASTITIFNCVGIVLGTYDASTGDQIQSGTRHAKVYVAGGNAIEPGTCGASRNTITIDNIDARALNRTVSLNNGISGNAATKGTFVGITVVRCILDGYYPITFSGADITVTDCEFAGYASGIQVLTTKCRIERNRLFSSFVHDGSFDAVQITLDNSDSLTADSYIVRDNNLLMDQESVKMGVYLYAGAVGTEATNTPTGPVVIERNTISNQQQGVYTAFRNSVVRNNTFYDIHMPGYPDGSGSDTARCITIVGSGNIVSGNLSFRCESARAVGITASSGTNTVCGNTFLDIGSGVTDPTTSAHSLVHKNNVYYRAPAGNKSVALGYTFLVRYVSTVTYTASNNCYYGSDLNDLDTFYAAGAVRTVAAYKSSYEPTMLNEDPLVDADGRPLDGSPLYHAGTHTGYTLDAAGRLRHNPPTVGAYEFFDPAA